MIKAVFFDVDGTLISSEQPYVSNKVIEALKKLRARGIKLFIASGRHFLELDQLGINDQLVFDGYLTLNGGYCFNSKETIYSNPIDKQNIASVVEYIIQNNLACCFVEKDGLYVNLVDNFVIKSQIFLNTPTPPVKNISRALKHDVYQIDPFVSSDEMENIMSLTKNCKYTQWYDYGYDVIPKNSGKQEGIKAILKYYGLKSEEVMAFGDGHNDIEMLSLVGIGVCMENGHEDVKLISDFVTKSVYDDGVVYALEYFNMI